MTLETPVYVTWSTPRTSRRTAVLLASLRANEPEIAPVVIDAMTSSQWDPSVDTRSIRDVIGNTDTFGQVLNPDDAVAYALPRLMDDLASQGKGAMVINPNVIVTASTKNLAHGISPDSIMVGATRGAEPTSRTPRLDQVQSSAVRAPTRVLVVGPKADQFRSLLRSTMDEVILDPFMRRPAQVLDWVTTSAIESGLAGSLPAHLIVGLADYRVDSEAGAVFLDAESLWAALDQQEKGVETTGYGGTPIGTLLMELRVHDLGPLKEPLEFIESEVESSLRAPEPYHPASDLILDIRRASDPLGHRWGPGGDGDFHKWLYDTNEAGLTRLAHLVWLARPDLMQTFPEVRWEASRLRRWNDVRAVSEFGTDFFDPSVEPTVSEGKWVPPPHAMGRSERMRNAVAWRYKLARSLIPGMKPCRALGNRRQNSSTRFASSRRWRRPASAPETNRSHSWAYSDPTAGSVRPPGRHFTPWSISICPSRCWTPRTNIVEEHHGSGSRSPPLRRLRGTQFDSCQRRRVCRATRPVPSSAWWQVQCRHVVLGGSDTPPQWLPAFEVDQLWLASNYLADVFGQYGRVQCALSAWQRTFPSRRTPVVRCLACVTTTSCFCSSSMPRAWQSERIRISP